MTEPAGGHPASTRPSLLASVSVRCLGFGAALLLAVLSGAAGGGEGLLAAIGVGIVILAFDRRSTFTLRNFFLVYTVALFVLGVPLFKLSHRLYGDMVLFLALFLAGYLFGSLRRAAPHGTAGPRVEPGRPSMSRILALEEVMLVLAVLNMVLLAYQISRYGIGGFYSGQGLIDQLTTYGKPSVSGGVVQVITFTLRYCAIAVSILYVQSCLEAGVKVRYRYPLLLLVLVPVAQLARSDALHGAGLLLVANAADRRISSRGAADALPGPDRASHRQPRRAVALWIAMVIAVPAGLVIGALRQSQLAPHESQSAFERSLPILESELSPIEAYSDIKGNMPVLGRKHGSTIVLPLVFKVVPRGVFPGKPLNSGAYYMSVIRPAEYQAGFALPPTFFGDTFLNFGPMGSIVGCLLVGMASARLDVAYREPRLARLPWFLIVFVSYYSLLRSPLSETLASMLLTSLAFLALRALVRARPLHRPSTTSLQPAPITA